MDVRIVYGCEFDFLHIADALFGTLLDAVLCSWVIEFNTILSINAVNYAMGHQNLSQHYQSNYFLSYPGRAIQLQLLPKAFDEETLSSI